MTINHDLTKILKPFKDKWVAISQDMRKVFASGNSLMDVRKKLTQKQKDAYVMRVSAFIGSYEPHSK